MRWHCFKALITPFAALRLSVRARLELGACQRDFFGNWVSGCNWTAEKDGCAGKGSGRIQQQHPDVSLESQCGIEPLAEVKAKARATHQQLRPVLSWVSMIP